MTVQVVTYTFQGVLDSVEVFDTVAKALIHLQGQIGIQCVEDFAKWQETNAEGDTDEEYHWFEAEVQ